MIKYAIIKNIFRRNFYYILQKIYRFDKWHIVSLEDRDYALLVIRIVNGLINTNQCQGEIIEIGCGMGDIISAIDYPSRLKKGYDISKSVIKAARLVHRKASFEVGSFSSVNNRKISVLIAVNFLHGIEPNLVELWFHNAISENDIEYILVDTVQSPPYEFSHDFINLFNALGYVLEYKSRGGFAWEWTRKHILVFKRVS